MSKPAKISSKMMVMVLATATSGFLLSAMFIAPTLFVNAFPQQKMMGLKYNGTSWNGTHNNNGISDMPRINGTLNIKDGINSFLTKNISVPFTTAAQTAQKEITNGTIINGKMDITQGYVTYNFGILNSSNGMLYKVIIDPGNGSVLYKSQGMSIESPMLGMEGMHGFGHGWFGHGYGPDSGW
jgi:hypothetical protein